MGKVIGIDLGTTNSCVSVIEGGEPLVIPNDEGTRTTPSVVAFPREGDRIVGAIARRQAVTNATRTVHSAKRLIGRRYQDEEVQRVRSMVAYSICEAPGGDAWIDIGGVEYSPQQIAAMVLDRMKQTAEAYLGETVTEAVITVPAYFNDAQRAATRDAGRIAGLDVLRIINEPTAAALAYGLGKKNHERVAVFDLGGGTFDISVLEIDNGVFEVRSTNGDTFLGGDDFDARVVTRLMEQFKTETGVDLSGDAVGLQRVREAAERAKHELSSVTETEIHLPFLAVTADGPQHLMASLSRAQFEALVVDLIDRLDGPCRAALKDARIKAKDLDAVLLVGGMTRMPRVQEKVAEIFGMQPDRGINPDEVVAVGAAIQGSVLKGEVKDVLLLDVTPLSLGIETAGGMFEPIIVRNTTIPCRKSKIFTTAQDNQDMVRVHIVQGEREMVEDNRSLGILEMRGLPPVARGVPEIEVIFELDSNGLLNVHAKDKGTGRQQSARIVSSSGLSSDDIEQMIVEAEEHRARDRDRRALAEERNQLDGLIYATRRGLEEYAASVSSDDALHIREAVHGAESVLDSANGAALGRARERLALAAQRLSESIYASARADQAMLGGAGYVPPEMSIDEGNVDDEA
ncbi:MAG: molecular chaperone DnaK [Myxococcales bacterium]|nr:molecular chaperone DnaK [Myxococcales bacterium]